jgi:CDP-glycerol glycerophosphotransferase
MSRPSFVRRAARGLRRRIGGTAAAPAAARRQQLRRHYRERLGEPLDPGLAVFAAYWYRGYACNPRAIHEKARELVPGLRGVWVVRPEHAAAMPPDVEVVHPATPEYFDVLARASVLVNNVNWPNNVVKREGATHVMTHHGTPLKRMGLDLRDLPGREKPFDFDQLLARVAKWDYSVSANPFTTPIWERVYPGDWRTLETGYPRNDVLANATPESVRAARAEVGLADGETAVLYAPTHREYATDGSELLDLHAFAAALPEGHIVLARQHYLQDAGLGGSGRVRDVSKHPSVEQLCLAADVLVTDYSSIMFDYAVLDRPILVHAADWETYRERRGTYFDLLADPPGAVSRTTGGAAEAIATGAIRSDDATAARAAFRQRFCSLEDGHAAERVVRAVWRLDG